MTKPLSSPPARGRVGTAAREQLLEAAGELFAEKGFERTTSREICERARMNTAAVNYHFGGIDAIYAEALVEAHRRAIWIEAHAALQGAGLTPQQRLLATLRQMVWQIAQPSAKSWEMRLLSREFVAPTAAHVQFIRTAIEPQRRLMQSVIAEYLECDVEDQRVGYALISIISPCMFLAMSHRESIVGILPGLAVDENAELERLLVNMECFVIGGLAALRQRASVADSPTEPT